MGFCDIVTFSKFPQYEVPLGKRRLVWRSKLSIDLKWGRVVALGASLPLLLSTAVAAESISTPLPESRAPCAAFAVDAEYVSQFLVMDLEGGNVPLRIPIQFLEDFWDHKQGFADTAQLFRVEIGTFQPVSRKESGRRNKEGIWNWITFVVKDVLPLERLAVLSAESWSAVIGGDQARRLESYAPSPGPFGLAEIRSDAPQPTSDFRTNTFIAQSNDGVLAAVLSCNALGSFPFPGCQHWFRAAGMDVELSYRRTELPNWKALQEDVTTFLICATRKHP